MSTKPSTETCNTIHFPTTTERGPIPFPTSKPKDEPKPAADAQPEQEQEPSAEELRLMADTMPGEGPGD